VFGANPPIGHTQDGSTETNSSWAMVSGDHGQSSGRGGSWVRSNLDIKRFSVFIS